MSIFWLLVILAVILILVGAVTAAKWLFIAAIVLFLLALVTNRGPRV